jgi:hypothetical protein
MLSRQEELVERREVLENEKRLQGSSSGQGSTFLQHTHNDVGGRFAAISSPVVVGTKQIPQYPAAFFQRDPVPDEPALGIDINEMPPVGEPHELAASIAKQVGPGASIQAQTGDPTAAPSQPSSRGLLISKRVGSPSLSSRTFRRA